MIPKRSAILLSEDHSGPGADLFLIACEHEFEGIVSKRLDKPNRSGRRAEWLKTKCVQSDTFVIIGFQPGSGAVRTPLANIKVATFDGTRLRYAGAVGTGFSEAVCLGLARASRPACRGRGASCPGAVWVDPSLRAEVAYRGVTTASELRHASFRGLEE